MTNPLTPREDLENYLKPEEVEELIKVATNPRDRLLVRTLLGTGIRVSELISIRIHDIDFGNGAIVIKVRTTRKKDAKAIYRRRVVPVDQGTLDIVNRYLNQRKQFPHKADL